MYDAAKQKVVELVDSAKTFFYSSLVSGSKTCKHLFHTMSTLLGKSKQMSFPTVSDSKTLPDNFAEYFKNKIVAIRQGFGSSPILHTFQETAFSGTPFSAFSPVTKETVKKLILSAAPKFCELDPIPTKLLLLHLDLLLPTITNIMNKSMTSGIFPSEFKTAAVKPLPKKKPTLTPTTLRTTDQYQTYLSSKDSSSSNCFLISLFITLSVPISQHIEQDTAQRPFSSEFLTTF